MVPSFELHFVSLFHSSAVFEPACVQKFLTAGLNRQARLYTVVFTGRLCRPDFTGPPLQGRIYKAAFTGQP